MSQDTQEQARRRSLWGRSFCLFILLLLLCLPRVASSQEQQFSVSFDNIPLANALQQIAEEFNISLVYSTDLVSPHKADCVLDSQSCEDLLRCVLQQSKLDYTRLPSGTYVVKEPKTTKPLYGYFTGTVIDQKRGIPIPDAHVLLSSEEGKRGSTTNNVGQFIFPKLEAGRYAVSTSHISYESWQDSITVLPDQHTTGDIPLQPEPILISPIVIDGLQHRLHPEDLDHEEIRADNQDLGHNGRDPAALLKQAASLVGVSASDATADIHLQGAQAGAHQLRLNGAPVFLPRNTIGFISPISTFALSKLRIHKAGFGVDLGSQTAGVIQGEYNLDKVNRIAAQLNQHSLNLRLQRYASLNSEASLSFMLALRQSIWDVYPPSELKNTISAWSVPDFFQVTAPARLFILATEDLLTQDPSQLRPDLSLNYTDIHAAIRARLNAEETITASYYAGQTELDSGDTQFVTAPPLSARMASRDQYTWRYNVGQVRYNYLISGAALFSGQFRYSETSIDHRYGISVDFPGTENEPISNPIPWVDFAGDNVEDSNRISELGSMVSLDVALRAHHIQVGAEGAITQSMHRFPSFRILEQLSATNPDAVFIDPYINLSRVTTERLAFFAQDIISLGTNWEATVGVRTTLFHHNLYSEPRLSIRYDHVNANDQAFSFKTSIGMYRQFIGQIDVSTLNSFKLLPTTRIWFPFDHTVTPPRTTLISQAVAWTPRPSWAIRLEGYINLQGKELTMNYDPPFSLDALDSEVYDVNDDGFQDGLPEEFPVLEFEQQDFLTEVTSRKHGLNAVVSWHKRKFSTEVQYSYSHATSQAESLFGGQTYEVPWNVPHRTIIQFTYKLLPSLSATLRTKSKWGRSWGLQRAYYDYFGNRESTRYRINYDFGSPSDHLLPPFHQLDLSVAYTHKLERTEFQFRFDLLNALDRKNVIDWRLIYDLFQNSLVEKPRYSHGVMPVFAVGVKF